MPTPTKGTRLGGGAAHQRRMLSNLAVSLFEHDSIRTTETKAKRLRPVAERLITKAKRGDLAARRQEIGRASCRERVQIAGGGGLGDGNKDLIGVWQQ